MSSQLQPTTIKMMYHGELKHITCPLNAKYEDFFEIVLKRFKIPDEFKDTVTMSTESKLTLNKDTFLYITRLFPNPENIFYVRENYRALLLYLHLNNNGQIFSKPIKRKTPNDKDKTDKTAPVTIVLPGYDESDEPQGRRPNTKIPGDQAAPSRRSIRF